MAPTVYSGVSGSTVLMAKINSFDAETLQTCFTTGAH
jgi:hypothetical protein